MNTKAIDSSQREITSLVHREGKYLTFSLGNEEYGIGILKIREIIGMMNITTIPQSPQYVKGVINLRGKIIPVVDLRLRFGMDARKYNERTCIIVVDLLDNARSVNMGIVVDSVSEVLNIKAVDIENTPNFVANLNTEYILGMAKSADSVKILLDIDRVLSGGNILDIDILENAA